MSYSREATEKFGQHVLEEAALLVEESRKLRLTTARLLQTLAENTSGLHAARKEIEAASVSICCARVSGYKDGK